MISKQSLFLSQLESVLPKLRRFLVQEGRKADAVDAMLADNLFHLPDSCPSDISRQEVRKLLLKDVCGRLPNVTRSIVKLAVLSDVQLETYILVSGCGCSYKEAADVCGVPEGTIQSRLHRARKLLKSQKKT